ncbi:Uncharacterised protein [Mycobacteroides abscessus subsp. abscessus]|nr:Uncharacterised protein [Mycobacteroides abscessus subsp. abscessus]
MARAFLTALSTSAPSDNPIAVPGPPLRMAFSRLGSPISIDSPMLGPSRPRPGRIFSPIGPMPGKKRSRVWPWT